MSVPAPGTSLGFTTLPNLRDLGGWSVPGGCVRRGVVYRSTELHGLAGPDVDALAALGLRTVYDLRTAAEREARPDRLPDGTRDVHLDVLADVDASVAAQLPTLIADPAKMHALFADGRGTAMFSDAYRDIVRLPSARAAYRTMFSELAENGRTPALFHCTTGKDRTGWAAASLLLLLGCSEGDARRDYLLTNEQLLPALQPITDAFTTAGGDPELLRTVLGVQPAYLDAAFHEMTATFGDIEGYFADGLGLDRDAQAQLRSVLIDAG